MKTKEIKEIADWYCKPKDQENYVKRCKESLNYSRYIKLIISNLIIKENYENLESTDKGTLLREDIKKICLKILDNSFLDKKSEGYINKFLN